MAKKNQDALVQYGDFTLDEVSEQEKEAESQSGMGLIFKIPQGRSIIRAIPPKPGERLMKVAYVHYIDVPGVGRVNFNCPRIMAKQACPACAQEAKLIATGSEVDSKKAYKLKAKRRLYMPIIVRGEEDNGPRILAFGKMIEDQLLDIRKDEDDGGNFAHPISGFDLKLMRKGEKQNDTEYKVSKTGEVKPLSEDAAQMKDWIENQPSASRYLRVLSARQIEAKLNGEEIDEDEDEEAPPRRPAKPATSGKPSGKKPKASIDEEIEDGEIVIEE